MRVSKKRQIFVALVGISLLSLVFLGLGCDGGGGGGGPAPDPCAGGPVPCLTEDWGDAEPGATYYIFETNG